MTASRAAVVAASSGRVLILSSVDRTEPFGYYGLYIAGEFKALGYSVTTLKDDQIGVDLIMSGLNNYDIVLWRTDTYNWAHTTYYYVGEIASKTTLTKYSSEIAARDLDVHAGIIGISLGFFQKHFLSPYLRNVKLAILLFSMSNSVASAFLHAGAQSVIFCVSDVTFQFGTIDDLAAQVVAYLAKGYTVSNSIWTTVTPYLSNSAPEDPNLDSIPSPPFWYTGEGSLTIK
jgi:hypothetical protein